MKGKKTSNHFDKEMNNNLKSTITQKIQKVDNSSLYFNLVLLFSLLALAGVLYLVFSFSTRLIPETLCNISSTSFNCTNILTSTYARFYGQYLYLYGLLFLAIELALLAFIKHYKNKVILFYSFFVILLIGSIISIYLLFIEFSVLKYICLPCTISLISILAMVPFSLVYKYSLKEQ